MAELHATMNISLDGCCDHTQVIADDEFHERISYLFEQFSALLFGRKTYELLYGYWPGLAASEDGTPGMVRLAHLLNAMPKYVVSQSKPAPGWQAERVDATQEAISEVLSQADGNMLLVASPTLAHTVLKWNLIDVYHLVVSPLVAGHGPYFLEGIEVQMAPSLLDVSRLKSGVLLLRYDLESSTGAA